MKIVCAVLALLTAADAAIIVGSCSDIGTKKQTETWTCNVNGTVRTAVCGKEETTCYCDGEMLETSGSGTWVNGVFDSGVSSTWDCSSKCSGSGSGSQYSEEHYYCPASEIDSTGN